MGLIAALRQRGDRRKRAARLRGKMLAQQWVNDVHRRQFLLAKLDEHNAKMADAIKSAQERISSYSALSSEAIRRTPRVDATIARKWAERIGRSEAKWS